MVVIQASDNTNRIKADLQRGQGLCSWSAYDEGLRADTFGGNIFVTIR